MNRWMWAGLAALWFAFVFVVVGWLTFPSSAVAARASYELGVLSNGSLVVEMDGLSPWWLGGSARGVRVAKLDGDEALPIFFGDHVAARTGLFGLLSGRVPVQLFARIGRGTIDASADFATVDGKRRAQSISFVADDVPVEDLLLLAAQGSSVVTASGGLDLDVSLDLASGRANATGDVSLQGDGVIIDTVSVPSVGLSDTAVGAVVDELDLRLKFDDGKGSITRGLLRTTFGTIEVEGTVTLAERFDRSKVELEFMIELASWTGTPLESFRSLVEGFMKSAAWDDGTYHYKASSVLGRFDMGDIVPERERSRRTRPSAASSPSGAPSASATPGAVPLQRVPVAGRPTRPTVPDAAAGARRAGSASAARRARAAERAARERAADDEDLDDEDLDDEDLDDEPLDDEFDDVEEAY